MDSFIENVEEIALAVEDPDGAVALFEELFDLEFNDTWTVPADSMSVRCAHIGSTMLHIVSSMSEDAVIAKFIRERGEGVHHVALRVRDMDEAVTKLREKGVRLVPEEPVSLGPSGPSYIFVHPRSVHGVLIELIWPGKSVEPVP